MKLENQVTSLEISKKLKELGVKQESLFCWQENSVGTFLSDSMRGYHKDTKVYPAFTVTELGMFMREIDEEMPWFANGSYWYWGKVTKGKSMGRNIEIEVPTSEADARGKMLIYLLENGLMK